MLLRLAVSSVVYIPRRNLTKKPKTMLSSFDKSTSKSSESGPPYNHFVQIGDPVLKLKANPVPPETIKSEEIQNVIKSMIYVLDRYDGIGVSAPQIGVPLQIFAIQLTKSQLNRFPETLQIDREMEIVPLQFFINPTLSVVNNQQIFSREGCCSLHGFSCRVSRNKAVRVKALNEKGEDVEVTASGWTSRIIQHEMDHLNGQMITDRMEGGSLSLEYWNLINIHRGNFRLSYDGIKAGPKKWFTNFFGKGR
uniref:Peptide deformylase n=1 Tax=Acartia pacifica TaxID=335913 RepID=A0A0U2T6T6_ACAPC|nr:mitochondrial peptide deformylase [Acartia pacifica]